MDWEFFKGFRLRPCGLFEAPLKADSDGYVILSDEQYDILKCEFTTGTGITAGRTELHAQADESFHEYIEDLKEISRLDINRMAREILEKRE